MDCVYVRVFGSRWPAGMRLGLLVALGSLLAVLFYWAAVDFGYKRYFFSVEMLAAFLLLALGYRWIGGALFLLAVGLEFTLGAASVFRLFDLNQIATMASFAWEANSTYVVAFGLLMGGLVLFWWMLQTFSRSIKVRYVLLAGGMLVPGQFLLSFQDGALFHPTEAQRDHLLFGSSGFFLSEVLELNKLVFKLGNEDVDFYDLAHPSAVQLTLGPSSSNSKTLVIVAESWGLPHNQEILNRQLLPLRKSLRVKDLGLRDVRAVGATVFAEFRELCGKVPSKLKFSQVAVDEIGDCLPAQLRQRGVKTVSLHGAKASMYERELWYPMVGFDEMWFKDNLPNVSEKTCYSFPGLCDRDLFKVVAQTMDTTSPIFMYWLTLNSHLPYDRRDIDNFRPSLCSEVLSVGSTEQLCNYQNLQIQFFEQLALLLERPVMRGVEVVVVGDHTPVFNDQSSRDQFEPLRVPMLHFKVE